MLRITFKRDSFWKRFVRFDLDTRDIGLNIENKSKKTVSSSEDASRFSRIHRNFVSTHDTLFIHIPFHTTLAELHMNQLTDQVLRDFCNDHAVIVEKTSDIETFDVPMEHLSGFIPILNKITANARALIILLNSSIVQLCSQFDNLVSDIVTEIIRQKPDILNSSDRKIEYADLYGFDSIESLKAHFSEKFVEGLIRKSRTDQFAWFSHALGIPMTRDLAKWPKFIEINERRNLLTHTGGVVSSAYIKNCRDADFCFSDTVNIGDNLQTDLDYYKEATEISFEVGLKLIQVVWRKTAPHEIENADRALINAGFKLIVDNRLELATEIHRFATEVIKNVKSEKDKRVLLVNHANCYNLRGQPDVANELLARVDWSASDLQFQICVAAVRGEVDTVVSLMRRALATDEIKEDDFRSWPVFRKMHEEGKFRDSYKELFGKELIPATMTPKIDLQGLIDFGDTLPDVPPSSPKVLKEIFSP